MNWLRRLRRPDKPEQWAVIVLAAVLVVWLGYRQWREKKDVADAVCEVNCEVDALRAEINQLKQLMGTARPAFEMPRELREYAEHPGVKEFDRMTMTTGMVVWSD